MILIVSILFAALLGVSAHRAGICTVKAVAELLSTRRPYLLLSFLKTSSWAFAVILAGGLAGYDSALQHWPFSWTGMHGGLVLGVGSGLNGGCVFSTLTRAADGNFNVLAAVAMWPAGTLITGLFPMIPGEQQHFSTVMTSGIVRGAVPLLVPAMAAWAIYEAVQIGRHVIASGSLLRFLHARRFRLSAAAALIGICNGFLFHSYQNWSFTSAVVRTFSNSSTDLAPSLASIWILFGAAASGMSISAQLRGSFSPARLRVVSVLQHGAGGAIMGIGAGMIPGGNDALILYGIPSFSPHAIPSFAAVLAGIALFFIAIRLTGRTPPHVMCRSDICLTN